jgi:hypothetical protein
MGLLKLRLGQQSLVAAQFDFSLLDHLRAGFQALEQGKHAEVQKYEQGRSTHAYAQSNSISTTKLFQHWSAEPDNCRLAICD